MLDLTPRELRLLDYYPDGEDARHYSFAIQAPQAADLLAITGQFFMLCVPGYGEAAFTYVSTPDKNGHFTALVRRVGSLSRALFELPVGAVLGYRGPFGHGWPLLFNTPRVLVVAGGCGLATVAGVLDEVCEQPLSMHMSVIYAARSTAAQVLACERKRWREKMHFIETFDQPVGAQRGGSALTYFDDLFARQPPQALFCSGPQTLMLASAEAALQRGVAANKIWLSIERRMHCGVGLCGHCYLGDSYVCMDGPTYRYDRYLALQGGGQQTGQLALC
jgi:anaerobic sulfite reductase subunit B